MNFSQLQSLLALAEHGSFTEAAYNVNLTQSAVSHSLATLESELGVTLLERNRKGIVSLTPAGQRIIPHVRALLGQAEAIEQEAKAARGMAAGKLRVGSVNSFFPGLLAGVLTAFKQRYPEIEVVFFEGTMQEVYEWIGSSIIDIGFVLYPAKGMESRLVATDELCIVVPVEHRLSSKRAVTVEELRDENFIMAKSLCSCQVIEMAGLEIIKPQIRYQASDSATILAMVREGLGITLLPRMMLPENLEGLVALSLSPSHHMQVGLAFRSQTTLSHSAKLFVQTAMSWSNEQAA